MSGFFCSLLETSKKTSRKPLVVAALCAMVLGLSPGTVMAADDTEEETPGPEVSAVLDQTESAIVDRLVVTDIVTYTGLEAGKRYIVEGTAYFLGKDGMPEGDPVSDASVELCPEESNGECAVDFVLNCLDDYAGKTLVFYEEVIQNWGTDAGKVVVDVKDCESKTRKLRFPKISFFGDDVFYAQSSTDVAVDGYAEYENLDPESEYKLKWTLYSLDGYRVPFSSPVWVDTLFTPGDLSESGTRGLLHGTVRTAGKNLAGERLYLKGELFGASGKLADTGLGSESSCVYTRVTEFVADQPVEQRSEVPSCFGDGKDRITIPVTYAGFPTDPDGYYVSVDLSVPGRDGRDSLGDLDLALTETSDFGDNTLDLGQEFVTRSACCNQRIWSEALARELDLLKLGNEMHPDEPEMCPLCNQVCLGTKKESIKNNPLLQEEENTRPRNRVTSGTLELPVDVSAYTGKEVHLWVTLHQRNDSGADVSMSKEQKLTIYVPNLKMNATFDGGGVSSEPLEDALVRLKASFTGLDPNQAYVFDGVIKRSDTQESLGTFHETFTAGAISHVLDLSQTINTLHLSGKQLVFEGQLFCEGKENQALASLFGEGDGRVLSIVEAQVPVVGTFASGASIGGRVLECSKDAGLFASVDVTSGLQSGKSYTLSMEAVDTTDGTVLASGTTSLEGNSDGQGQTRVEETVNALDLVGHPVEISVKLLDGDKEVLSRSGSGDPEMTVCAAGGDVELSENSKHVSTGENVPIAMSLHWSGLTAGVPYRVVPSLMDGDGTVLVQGKGTLITPDSDFGTHHAILGADLRGQKGASLTAGFAVETESGKSVVVAESEEAVLVDQSEPEEAVVSLSGETEFPMVRYQERAQVTGVLTFSGLEAGDYQVEFSASCPILEGNVQEFSTDSGSGTRAFSFVVDGRSLEAGALPVQAKLLHGSQVVCEGLTMSPGVSVAGVSIPTVSLLDSGDVSVLATCSDLLSCDGYELVLDVLDVTGNPIGVSYRAPLDFKETVDVNAVLGCTDVPPGTYQVRARLYLKDSLIGQRVSSDSFEISDLDPEELDEIVLKANLLSSGGSKIVPCEGSGALQGDVKYYHLDQTKSYQIGLKVFQQFTLHEDSDREEIFSGTVDVAAGSVNGNVKFSIPDIDVASLAGYYLVPEVSIQSQDTLLDFVNHTTDTSGLSIPSMPGHTLSGSSYGMVLIHGDTQVSDQCAYWNLDPGAEYEMDVELIDFQTGEPLMIDGKGFSDRVSFVPEYRDGSVSFVFPLDISKLAGNRIGSRGTLYKNGIAVAKREYSENDAIRIPVFCDYELYESAVDGDQIAVVDHVRYENVLPNCQYRVVFDVLDTTDGSTIPGASYEYVFLTNTSDGGIVHDTDPGIMPMATDDSDLPLHSVDHTLEGGYSLDTTGLGGHLLRPRARLYMQDALIYDDTWGEWDKSRAIYVEKQPEQKSPSLEVTSCWSDGSVEAEPVSDLEAKVLVSYHDLDATSDYQVKAILSGIGGVSLTSEALFTPKFGDGVVELTVPVDGELYAGGSFGVSASIVKNGEEETSISGSGQGLIIKTLELSEPDVSWTVGWGDDKAESVKPGAGSVVNADVSWSRMAGHRSVTFLMEVLSGSDVIGHASKSFERMEAKGDLAMSVPVDSKAYAGEDLVVRLTVSGNDFSDQRLMGRVCVEDAPVEVSDPVLSGSVSWDGFDGDASCPEDGESLTAIVELQCKDLVKGESYEVQTDLLLDGKTLAMKKQSVLADGASKTISFEIPVSGDLSGKSISVKGTLSGAFGTVNADLGVLKVKERPAEEFEEKLQVSASMEWEAGGTEIAADGKQYALCQIHYDGISTEVSRTFTVKGSLEGQTCGEGYKTITAKDHAGDVTVRVPILTDSWKGQTLSFALEVTGEDLTTVTKSVGTLSILGDSEEQPKEHVSVSGMASWEGGGSEIEPKADAKAQVTISYDGVFADQGRTLTVSVRNGDGVLSQVRRALGNNSGTESFVLDVDTSALAGSRLEIWAEVLGEGFAGLEKQIGTLSVKSTETPKDPEKLQVSGKVLWTGGSDVCDPKGSLQAEASISYSGMDCSKERTFLVEVLDGTQVISHVSKTFVSKQPNGDLVLQPHVRVSEFAGKTLSVRLRVSGDGLETVTKSLGNLRVNALEEQPPVKEDVRVSGTASWKSGGTSVVAGGEQVVAADLTYSGLNPEKRRTAIVSVFVEGDTSRDLLSQKTVTLDPKQSQVKVELPVKTDGLSGKTLSAEVCVCGDGLKDVEVSLGTLFVTDSEKPGSEDLQVSAASVWKDGGTEADPAEDLRAAVTVSYDGITSGVKRKVSVDLTVNGSKVGSAWKEFTPKESQGQVVVEVPANCDGLFGEDVLVSVTLSGSGFEDVLISGGVLQLRDEKEPPVVDPDDPDQAKEQLKVNASVSAPDGGNVLPNVNQVRAKAFVNFTGISTSQVRKFVVEAYVGDQLIGRSYRECLAERADGQIVLEVPLSLENLAGSEVLFKVLVSGRGLDPLEVGAGKLRVQSDDTPTVPDDSKDQEKLSITTGATWEGGYPEVAAGGQKRVLVEVSYNGISQKLPRTFTACVKDSDRVLGEAYKTIVAPKASGKLVLEVPVETDGLSGKSLAVQVVVSGEELPDVRSDAGMVRLLKQDDTDSDAKLSVETSWKTEQADKDGQMYATVRVVYSGLGSDALYRFSVDGTVNGQLVGNSVRSVSVVDDGELVLEVPVSVLGYEGKNVGFLLTVSSDGWSRSLEAGSLVIPEGDSQADEPVFLVLREGHAYGSDQVPIPFEVEYKGLESGVEYVLEVVLDNGSVSSYRFVPESGFGILSGNVQPKGLRGQLSASARLLRDGSEVAACEHVVLGRAISIAAEYQSQDKNLVLSWDGLEIGQEYLMKVVSGEISEESRFVADQVSGDWSVALEPGEAHVEFYHMDASGEFVLVASLDVTMNAVDPGMEPSVPDTPNGGQPGDLDQNQNEQPDGNGDGTGDTNDDPEPADPPSIDPHPVNPGLTDDPDDDRPVFDSPVVKPNVDDVNGDPDSDPNRDTTPKTGLTNAAKALFMVAGICFALGWMALLIRKIRKMNRE